MKYYLVNDSIKREDEASISVNDLGLLRGYAIFDFFRTSKGKPLFLEDYLDRFFNSARAFELNHQLTREYLRDQIDLLNQKNGFEETGFKLVLTGGNSVDGFTPDKANFMILPSPISLPSQELVENGVKLLLLEHIREEPLVKSTNYLSAVKSAKKCKEARAMDVLYYANGELSEVSRSNFYIVKNGKVITTDQEVLKGITRKKLIEILEPNEIELRKIKVEELKTADEAFLTSSTKRILPVTQIDDQVISNRKIGPKTKELLERFVEAYES